MPGLAYHPDWRQFAVPLCLCVYPGYQSFLPADLCAVILPNCTASSLTRAALWLTRSPLHFRSSCASPTWKAGAPIVTTQTLVSYPPQDGPPGGAGSVKMGMVAGLGIEPSRVVVMGHVSTPALTPAMLRAAGRSPERVSSSTHAPPLPVKIIARTSVLVNRVFCLGKLCHRPTWQC